MIIAQLNLINQKPNKCGAIYFRCTDEKMNKYESDSAILWISFQKGDWDAYTEIYNRHFKLLNNYGYKFTKDAELIEDAVHDLFVKLWTNKANLSAPVSVKNYLYKSLRGDLFKKLASHSRFVNIDDEGNQEFMFEVSFDHQLVANEDELALQQNVKRVIQTLPPRQQEIIYLRFYEGLSYEEISEIMGISVNSTYKLLYKGINNMHGVLGVSKLSLILLLSSVIKAGF